MNNLPALEQKTNTVYQIVPKTFDELMKYAQIISDSSFCPKAYLKKPGDVLVAMQYGSELGLHSLQSLQDIAVINGRPCVWGDAALAIVSTHKDFLDIIEWKEGSGDSLTAYCKILRRGRTESIARFSVSDARQANLWKKNVFWNQYPDRMLQMRARSFCMRNIFPDALKGMQVVEEVRDYEIKTVSSSNSVEQSILKALEKTSEERQMNSEIEINTVEQITNIENVLDISTLHLVEEEDCESLFEYTQKQIALSKDMDELSIAVTGINDFMEEGHVTKEEAENLRAKYSEKRNLLKTLKENKNAGII